ncbi:Molydopterin dinucleotide binding domain protein [uncultured archaeon]|nr:Molydopterin dinucleotide binding domain protein [uncultured archaeon]
MTVVTFRDIFQHEAEKKSRYSEEYRKLSAQIILDKQDMAGLGVKDGQNVLVKNDVGSVVVAVKTSEDDPHPGLDLMVNSPWSNQLVRDDVCETSIPGFKGISAQVSRSGENVTQISELFQRMTAQGA